MDPSCSALLGRDRELALIDRELDGAFRGGGGCLVVRGEPGVGKTALLDRAAATAAARGVVVLMVGGARTETTLPFAGLQQLVHLLRGGLGELPDAQRAVLEASLGIGFAVSPEPFGVALAFLELVTNSAGAAPLLVVVDDAQWMDRSTQEVLAFVGRRLQSDPVLMVFGVRTGHEDLFELSELPTIDLPPLAAADAATLLDAHARDLAVSTRARVLDAAQGNPLALVELPKVIGSEAASTYGLPLTARLERSFAAQLPDLPQDTRTLLLVAAESEAATLGEVLAAATALARTPVEVDAVDPAVRAGLVRMDGAHLRFRHPLIGSAIQQTASAAGRLAAHRALTDVVADPDRRAWHRAAAVVGYDDEAAAELERSAVRARRRGALTGSLTALQRAATLTADPGARAGRLLQAGELAGELGQVETAAVLARDARAHRVGPREAGRALMLEEMVDPGRFADENRIRVLVASGERVRRAGDVELAMGLLWQAASRCWWGGVTADVREEVAAGADRMGLAPDDPRLLAVLGYVAPETRGGTTLTRLATLAVDRQDVTALRYVAGAAMVLGHFPLAAARFAECAAELRSQGRLGLLARVLVSGCWPSIYLGDWDAVRTDNDEGARLAVETRQQMWAIGTSGNRGMLDAMRGDGAAARAVAVPHQEVAAALGVTVQYALAQQVRGLAALVTGDHVEAYALLRRMFLPGDAAHHYGVRCWAVADLADAAVRAGEVDEARSVVADLEPLAARTSSPFFHIGMRYARAVLSEEDGAETLFERALGADLAVWSVDRARLELAYGIWLRRRRRNADSRDPLRRACAVFDALGAAAWSRRAHEELRATGEVRIARRAAARAALSPQELRIAQLAAEGLTNREIGRHLYLSHRTVGAHLYRVFPKLGVASRSALAAALEERAPDDGPRARD